MEKDTTFVALDDSKRTIVAGDPAARGRTSRSCADSE